MRASEPASKSARLVLLYLLMGRVGEGKSRDDPC